MRVGNIQVRFRLLTLFLQTEGLLVIRNMARISVSELYNLWKIETNLKTENR